MSFPIADCQMPIFASVDTTLKDVELSAIDRQGEATCGEL
jgi:hypothetical protein